MSARIIFITGTDTGVGKTVLTSLLLCHLRRTGQRALALKPFCSGGRADAQLLYKLQEGDLTLDQVNPFYYPEPVAPLISARKHKHPVLLETALKCIQEIASGISRLATVSPGKSQSELQEFLLVEGSGGLLVPLGEGYTVRDLIARLGAEVLVVARNRLGTINHTLLTVEALPGRSTIRRKWPRALEASASLRPRIVLVQTSKPDPSCQTNPRILKELLSPCTFVELPFLGRSCASAKKMKIAAAKYSSRLQQMV
ncbi:MAG TPA: dethiobiotin synthase [Verrucomicrobiae bacterium]|jgi:dethiobiotin synthase|nr:dethiobiotin synthase [Verrucomicrobiae bacterium]